MQEHLFKKKKWEKQVLTFPSQVKLYLTERINYFIYLYK